MIYVNGDSYAFISNGKRFSEFLGEYYKCESINNSISGSCNNRIFRTSLRDLIELRKKHKDIKAVITLSFPLRTELWDADVTENRFINDGEFTSIQAHTSHRWFYDQLDNPNSKYKEFCKQFILYYNIEAETVKILQNIILLTAWCKINNIRYVIVSGTLQERIDLTTPFVSSLYEEVFVDKNVIDIFTQSFTEWCVNKGFVPIDNYTQEIHGKTYIIGHHGEQAHKSFAEFLIEEHFK